MNFFHRVKVDKESGEDFEDVVENFGGLQVQALKLEWSRLLPWTVGAPCRFWSNHVLCHMCFLPSHAGGHPIHHSFHSP